MTPNRPKSAKKSGSRKSSAGAMQTRLPQDPRSRFSLLWKHKIWTASALAAVILVAIGLAYQLLNGSTRNMASASAATFVGSETCAGCHRAEAQLWRGSQHQLAMQHADDKSVLGDFSGASFEHYGVHSRFFRKDGKFFVETDGPDGRLTPFQVKYTFGVEPLQQYLVEFPDGRLQALVARLGQPAEGPGRPALVPSLSGRGDQARRRAALDQAEPELELHVRGVPFDRRAQELRRGDRPLRHELRGNQRGLRGVSWPGVSTRRLGPRAAKLVAVRQER